VGPDTIRRTFVAVLVAILLVGTAGVSVWLMASAGVLSLGNDGTLPGAPLSTGTLAQASSATIPAAGGFRVAQPRDPFAPLITQPTETTVPQESTSTTGGTSTTGTGASTSTTGGTTSTTGSTTSTTSNVPTGTRVSLLEIRDESGVKKAVLTVDGETFTVGVGDTFADDFKVISLSTSSGVFMYKDSVFTLAVGQSIIK
jgi:hypothetical protein